METYLVTMLAKNRRVQVYIRSSDAASAFQSAKTLYPNALVVRAEKTSAHKRIE